MQYFKHFTKMRSDTKVRRLFAKYGLEGYGLYNLIIESIAGSIETENPLPLLEETCDDIACFYNGNSARIDEMVRFMIQEGLLEVEETEKKIACYKIYGYLEQSQTRSEKIRQLITAYKDKKDILDSHKCLRQSETKVIEENRKEQEENKNRQEESQDKPALPSKTKRIKKEKEEKKPYGTFKNVFLSDSEYNSLKEAYTENVLLAGIESVSVYVQGKPEKHYSNFNKVMLTWGIDAGKESIQSGKYRPIQNTTSIGDFNVECCGQKISRYRPFCIKCGKQFNMDGTEK